MNIIELAQECQLIGMRPHLDGIYQEALEKFAALVAAQEREAIAQMFEDAPALVQFAQNDKSGCLVCGFTPKLVIEVIRKGNNMTGYQSKKAMAQDKLAQPAQEPVGFVDSKLNPIQRQPLTDEQIEDIAAKTMFPINFARAIEAAHGIKENT